MSNTSFLGENQMVLSMYYGIEMLKKQGRMPFFWRKQSASGRGGCGGAKRRDHAAFSFGLWKKPCGQFLSIPLTAPHQSRLRQASFTFYGIAATGSYVPLDSLRDTPPRGEAFHKTEKEEGACLPLVFRFCLTQPQQPEPDGHCRCRKPCKLCGALRAHRTWGKPQRWERTASSWSHGAYRGGPWTLYT